MRNEKLYLGAQNMSTVTDELLTRKDVSRIFKVSIPSVIRWEAAGRLPAVRFGAGTVRYQRSAVEDLIANSLSRTESK
jgi:hypothetical protein